MKLGISRGDVYATHPASAPEFITVRSITVRSITVRSITVRSITVRSITVRSGGDRA